MPSESRSQHNYFEAIEHDPAFRHKTGVSRDVAQEFTNADERSHDWKKREHVAKKAAEQGMSPEIYKALYGGR
jgi:hypothetical protein